jgi:acyl-CoA thioester hydrolase
MKHILESTVYYADTDSYGVVWHGTYLRWMEQGRVEFCRAIGLDLTELMRRDIVIPVTNLNIRYKASAKLEDRIVTETSISKISPLTITFSQTIKEKNSGKVFIQAEVEVVAVNGEGRIYRRMPEDLKKFCKKAMDEELCQDLISI